MPDAPVIRRLQIRNYRGIPDFDWMPASGGNLLLGGGDCGKTTILEAIALLLRPSGSTRVTDSDYWLGDVSQGFTIKGTFFLPESVGVNQLPRMAYPWEWSGTEACLPDPESDTAVQDPVYVFRVRGTEDFEVFHEIVHPNGDTDHLPVSLRRRIGIIWLTGSEADRDLRLVYGSALDRLLSDAAMRARLVHEIGQRDVREVLDEDGKENLAELEVAFRNSSLPDNLGLGLTGGRRISMASLVSLTADQAGSRLPLGSWGSGTQRLAALQIAGAKQVNTAIALIDELERGLEPYRQRQLTEEIVGSPAQSFITTHSPAVLSAAVPAAMWHLDPSSRIGRLSKEAVEHAMRDPEAFLSRVTVVVEGATEVGFLSTLLEVGLGKSLSTIGIHISDAGGNATALDLMEGLVSGGLTVGALVDDEGTSPGRWKAVKERLADLLLQWSNGCTEAAVIGVVPIEDLLRVATDPEGDLTGERLRSLQERLRLDSKNWEDLVAASSDIRATVVEAATGAVPAWVTDKGDKKRFRKHSQLWFKSVKGGEELANKVLELGLWPKLRDELWPFMQSVCGAAEAHCSEEVLAP